MEKAAARILVVDDEGTSANSWPWACATRVLPAPLLANAATASGRPAPAHGTTTGATFTASIKRTGAHVAVSGSIPALFADYGIQNPSFAGVVTTDDHGTLEFLLNFTAA